MSRVVSFAGMKAERDPNEPGYEAKVALQEAIEASVIKHWRKQKRDIKRLFEIWFPGRKAISVGPFEIPEDEEFAREIINLILRGVTEGIELYTEGASIGFDATLINTSAAEWARGYALELIKDIDDTTQKAIRKAVAEFIETPGFTIGDLTKRLPFNEVRAKMISITETTRAYAQAQIETGKAMKEEWPGLKVVKRWYTNRDSIVCEICGPMDGQIVDIEQQFTTGLGGTIDAPPVHPNCRCWISTQTRIDETIS
jgi:SPP1 gp7 family putative phage head morphogenesis protein